MAKRRVDMTDQPTDDNVTDTPYTVLDEALSAGNNFNNAAEWKPELYDPTLHSIRLTNGIGSGNIGVDMTFKEADDRTYRTSFALPYGVLVALIDADHPDADLSNAIINGLIDDEGYTTSMGILVLGGIDQTAIRHKMLAGWRAAHNAEVDSDKTGFKKA